MLDYLKYQDNKDSGHDLNSSRRRTRSLRNRQEVNITDRVAGRDASRQLVAQENDKYEEYGASGKQRRTSQQNDDTATDPTGEANQASLAILMDESAHKGSNSPTEHQPSSSSVAPSTWRFSPSPMDNPFIYSAAAMQGLRAPPRRQEPNVDQGETTFVPAVEQYFNMRVEQRLKKAINPETSLPVVGKEVPCRRIDQFGDQTEAAMRSAIWGSQDQGCQGWIEKAGHARYRGETSRLAFGKP
eukprot:CAMPEP_0196593866 /NCGR_PEP_ID=MMETSP1081-20130531/76810_1 /TAXON_ID=36882 /ORGANISM="Pyramimonas amylifera, Strain CCMP720" /LENGTH=242 /DNA_ID=CAMNT_0041917979 /DNA_START=175 /DNA_END=903 /DNA_ORIENTATION=+